MKLGMWRLAAFAIAFCALTTYPICAQSTTVPAQNKAFTGAGNDGRAGTTSAVTTSTGSSTEPVCGILHLGRCILDLGSDEKGVFTSPFRIERSDSRWLLPLGAATGFAFAYDSNAAESVGVDQNRTDKANAITNFGSFYATGAESAGVYFLGLTSRNPKLAETGRLSAEAILASGTVVMATKIVSNRQRPLQGNGQGDFWANGPHHWEFDSSFPSDHAAASMALARVFAGEYPHWYVMVPAYGFAEAVGVSRILANQHFPSDVLIGQTIGFLTGGYVLRHHSQYYGRSNRFSSSVMNSIAPVADARTHAVGVSVEIPFGQ